MDAERYPYLYNLLTLLLTIPISSATCERSFLEIMKIKNWLRTSLSQDRFTNLSIIYIERDLLNKLLNEQILDKFAQFRNKSYNYHIPNKYMLCF